MSLSRRITALCVFVILISTGVAVVASSVSAAPNWWVESKALGTLESQTVLEEAPLTKVLVLKVAALELEVECKTFKGKSAKILGGSGSAGTDEAEAIKFGECKVIGSLSTKCEVQKEITTNAAKSELVEAEPPKDKLSAKTGETLASIEIVNKGAEKCPVAVVGKSNLTGSIAAKVLEPSAEQTHHTMEFAEGSGSTALFHESEAKLTGSAEVSLASGKKWSVLALPPPARVEWVDFKGNQPVLVDHLENSTHGGIEEPALKISEYGAAREVEWESPKVGEVTKNWPVAYVQTEVMKIETHFAVEKATREYLEKELEKEKEVEIIGETAVGGTAIKFTKKFTVAALKKQFGEHAEYIASGEMTVSAALPAKVLKSFATITWKWSLQPIGRATPIEQELGKSTHDFYLLYETPLAKAPILLTFLDLDTQEISGLASLSPEKVTTAIWEGFKHKEKAGACEILECSSVRIRTYKPTTGAVVSAGNTVLWYYESVKSGYTLREYIELKIYQATCVGVNTPEGLLEHLSGECGAWARAFKNALAIEGLKATRLVVFIKEGAGACVVAEACLMLVSKWGFAGGGGTSGEPAFPYLDSEVTDENGLSGQGTENPQSVFGNHQIDEVENNLYDPSYGSAPIGNGNAGERANNLKKLVETSISGYCRGVGGGKFNCARTEAGKPVFEAEVVAEAGEEE
jgi:hypothetical protein